MENDNFIWLHLSVFYNRNKWQKLLSDCILPFGEAILQEAPVDQLLIHCNHAQGENIRLSYRVKQEHAEYFLKRADHSFKTFLAAHPSVTALGQYPSKSFLANFPNNTVFYNLHRSSGCFWDLGMGINLHAYQHKFSRILIDACRDESFDDDTIFSFATYAIMGLLWAYDQVYGDLFSIAPLILKQKINDESITIPAMDDDVPDHDKMGFIEIAEDVFNKDIDDPENPAWLNEWKLFCRGSFGHSDKKNNDIPVPDTLGLLAKQLLAQLGIANNNKDILFYMIVDSVSNLGLPKDRL